MNAAIVTGGETFINRNGNMIGALIAEASRLLTIINLKKPRNSGILLSDKSYRLLENSENNINYFKLSDFEISNQYIIDVKGMQLNFREFFLEKKSYHERASESLEQITKHLKSKNPSKWYTVLGEYIKLIVSVLREVDVFIVHNGNKINSTKIIYYLEEYLVRWIKKPHPRHYRKIT